MIDLNTAGLIAAGVITLFVLPIPIYIIVIIVVKMLGYKF